MTLTQLLDILTSLPIEYQNTVYITINGECYPIAFPQPEEHTND